MGERGRGDAGDEGADGEVEDGHVAEVQFDEVCALEHAQQAV